MSVCLFAECRDDSGLPDLAAVPRVERALVYTPSSASDPYLHDGAPPPLVVQLYFASMELLPRDLPPGVASYEAMTVHRFAVPEPRIAAEPWCTYLVRYEGTATDESAWLKHYIDNHPPLMARLPGIRELEIYGPTDWDKAGPRRVRSLQRNKTAFDSPEALTAALNSPVRHEMRSDFARFPPFSGRVTHYPMLTRRIPGSRGPS